MPSKADFHTLLVFPPVWTPATPYLALPVLTAFLRDQGLEVHQFDASLDFFTGHLFTPSRLEQLRDRVVEREGKGELQGITPQDQALLANLSSRVSKWRQLLRGPATILDHLREQEHFFHPDTCMQAQHHLYGILRLVSLAYWPLRMTFNKYFHQIDSFPRMIRHCDDPEENLFLSYYTKVIPGQMRATTRLVGISISTAQQLVGALTLARWIKKNYPQVHVTLGGKHLLRLKQAFAREPQYLEEFCHSMIMDNGERPLAALIQSLRQSQDLTRVPNLVYTEDQAFRENPLGPREPLERLPTPDFRDLPLDRYLSPTPLIPVRLSEGCYWGKCTFCARYYLTGFNTVPPERAVEQMSQTQREYGVEDFTINDDCLTPQYLERLCRKILDRGLKVRMSLWCKPVHSFTRQRLELMYQAGVRLVRWGVETGHPRILKLMNKGTRLPETIRVLGDASRQGIWNHACIILGFPTETREEALETLDFLTRHQDIIHSSILYSFVLLDHSYIYNHPEEFSVHSLRWEGNVFSNVIRFSTRQGMDRESFEEFYDWARRHMRREVYRNPLWYYLRIREYLYLFVKKYGREKVEQWKVDPRRLTVLPPRPQQPQAREKAARGGPSL